MHPQAFCIPSTTPKPPQRSHGEDTEDFVLVVADSEAEEEEDAERNERALKPWFCLQVKKEGDEGK